MRRQRLKLAVPCIAVIAFLVVAGLETTPAPRAASSNDITVSLTVQNVLELDPSGCAPMTTGATDLGPIIAGQFGASTSDCTIRFGATGETASLRMRQTDGAGAAMFRPSTGKPDTGFDGDGHAVFDVGAVNGTDEARAIFQQADGTLLVGGITRSGSEADAFVRKFHSDGTVDTSFGGGTAIRSYSSGNLDGYTDMLVQPDGKVVAIGDTNSHNYGMQRFHANGNDDTSFGTSNGARLDNPCGGAGKFTSIALDNAGGFVLAGLCTTIGYASAARLNANGTPVGTFGTGGRYDATFCTPVAPYASSATFADVLVQPDDKIVLVGRCNRGGGAYDAFVVRLNLNGTPDTSFGAGGVTFVDFGTTSDTAQSVVREADGDLLIGGGASNGAMYVARLSGTDGSIDLSYGTSGKVTLPVGNAGTAAAVRGMSLEHDERLLVAGDAVIGATGDQVIARLRGDGSLDTSFNGTGTLVLQHGTSTDNAYAVSAAADGQIVIAGSTAVGSATRATVTRLNSTTIEQFGAVDSRWSDRTEGFFAACVRHVGGGAVTNTTTWPGSIGSTCGTAVTDDASWKAVPGAAGIEVATWPTPGAPTGTASLNFAVAAAASQSPGSYVAPITFELVGTG